MKRKTVRFIYVVFMFLLVCPVLVSAQQTSIFTVYGEVFLPDGLTYAPDGNIVTVKNLNTGVILSTTTGDIESGKYSVIFVDFTSNRAAAVGDQIKITVESPEGELLASPDPYTVTAEHIANQRIEIDTIVTPPSLPDISVTPTSYDYGSVIVGAHKDKTFVVKNLGIALLSVSSTTLIGDDESEFSIQSGGGSFDLNPEETRNVVVRFAPQSVGDKNATLRFVSNDPDENPYDVPLTGKGVSVLDISVTPPSHDYGSVIVGEYKDKTFEVKNEGTALLSVSSTTLVGDDASEFSIQSGGGSFDLNPEETRNVVGRFAPQSAGYKNATLRFVNPDENLFGVTLEGTGSPLKWRFKTGGDVRSSPAIDSDGTIYVGSNDDYLYALNPDGTQKWRFKTGGYVRSSPTIGSDGTIYVGSWDNYLYALNPNRTRKWRFLTGSNVSSSPAIGSDGTIYVGSLDNYLYAVNPDGTPKWKFKTGGDVSSSPAIGSDGTIYVGSWDSYLYAIYPDGTQKWKFKTGSGVLSSPAIGSDGTIYVGSWDNYLYALNPDGTQKWKFKTGGDVSSSPAIGSDGTIYVGSWDNYLYAIYPDGTLKWRLKTGGYVDYSPAIGSDDTIYVGSLDNYLYAIYPDGTQKWRFKTGGYVLSSPAIGSDGTIYVGSLDNYLYALNSESMGLADSHWPKFHHDNKNTGRVPLTVPDIAVTPDEYDYGILTVGEHADKTFVLKNVGGELLSVSSATLVDDDAFEFSVQSGGGSFDLNPGETRNFVVRFAPESKGSKNAALSIDSNDPDENPYALTLSGTGAPSGDVTGDGSVTALDAAFVLQASVGLITLTPEQEERADVSGENGVTAYDASLILRYVVGLLTEFPVDGGPVAPALTRKTYTLSVGKVYAKANERIVVPITVDDTIGILAGQLSLTYDAAYLNPIGVQVRNQVFPKNSVSKYNVRDGVLEFSFANAEELKIETGRNGNRPLLFVEFESHKTSTSTIPLTLSEAYLNEGLNILKVDGWFRFKPEITALLPNFPNPFNPDTWIPYQLSESATVTIRIYNVSGQLVRTLHLGTKPAGFYFTKDKAVYWDGKDNLGQSVASSVYFYILQAGKYTATRKMVILK